MGVDRVGVGVGVGGRVWWGVAVGEMLIQQACPFLMIRPEQVRSRTGSTFGLAPAIPLLSSAMSCSLAMFDVLSPEFPESLSPESGIIESAMHAACLSPSPPPATLLAAGPLAGVTGVFTRRWSSQPTTDRTAGTGPDRTGPDRGGTGPRGQTTVYGTPATRRCLLYSLSFGSRCPFGSCHAVLLRCARGTYVLSWLRLPRPAVLTVGRCLMSDATTTANGGPASLVVGGGDSVATVAAVVGLANYATDIASVSDAVSLSAGGAGWCLLSQ